MEPCAPATRIWISDVRWMDLTFHEIYFLTYDCFPLLHPSREKVDLLEKISGLITVQGERLSGLTGETDFVDHNVTQPTTSATHLCAP